MVTQHYAEQLFTRLTKSIETMHKAAQKIATTRAWEALGYESLGEAVKATIPTELLRNNTLKEIGIEMAKAGIPHTELLTLPGFGPASVVEVLTLAGRQVPDLPKRTSPSTKVTISVAPEQLAQWRVIAAAQGTTVMQIGLEVMTAYFEQAGPEVLNDVD